MKRNAAKHAAERERLSRALRRQWRAAVLLQQKLWTVSGLADALGVSKATCQRDIDLLSELFVVRAESDPYHSQRSYYRMVGTFKPRRAALRGGT